MIWNFGLWLSAIVPLFCCRFWKPLRVGEVLSKFCLILNSTLLMPMMISKLTQISCWVKYNDLELVLFNYMLLMVVIKACDTSMPNRSVLMIWWLGWMCLMLLCCHEPPFCSSCVLLCSKFKVIWKDKISEANFCFYKFRMFWFKLFDACLGSDFWMSYMDLKLHFTFKSLILLLMHVNFIGRGALICHTHHRGGNFRGERGVGRVNS